MGNIIIKDGQYLCSECHTIMNVIHKMTANTDTYMGNVNVPKGTTVTRFYCETCEETIFAFLYEDNPDRIFDIKNLYK